LAATGIGALARGGVTASRVPVVRDILSQAATRPGTFAASELGVAGTAGIGAATAQQLAPGSTLAELTGQIVGGAAPAGVVGAIRSAIPGRANIAQNIQRFQTAGTTPSLGQATENRAVQAIETIIGTVPGGAGRFRKVAENTQTQIGERINRLVGTLTTKADPARAGKVIKQGIIGEGGFLERFRDDASKLFNRIPIPDDASIPVTRTQNLISELATPTPGFELTSGELVAPQIRRIAEGFLQDVGQNGLAPFDAVKRLRSRIGEAAFSTDLVVDTSRAQLKRLYGALSDDLGAAARSAGPDAERAFNRANAFYKKNIQNIDDFLTGVTRKTSPEDVFLLATRGKEGATRLGTIRNSLKPNEWKAVAGTVLKRLGRARSGVQDELGEVFSTETFLTNWNNIDDAAKDALFKGRQFGTLRTDLDKIAATAARIRESSAVLANPSGTAPRLVNVAGTVGAGGIAAISGSPVLILGALGLPAASNVAARLMTNPKFVKWVAKSTEIDPARLPGHIARLSATLGDDAQALEDAQEFIGLLTGQGTQVQ
jgi:hypothetical protein